MPDSGIHDAEAMTPSTGTTNTSGTSCAKPGETLAQAGFVSANQYGLAYRDYKAGPKLFRPSVVESYRLSHTRQTYEFVLEEEKRWSSFDKKKLGVWEAIELLNTVVDDSDPDTSAPQIDHLFQTAEAARQHFPEEDWMHLTGLLHDMGKILAHEEWGAQPQWAVVGDTFPVGCAPHSSNIFCELFEGNPDTKHPVYSTKLGVYTAGCGLKNVHMSWGHDEYCYRVLVHNKCLLPPAALFIIRYHSFYPLHQHNAYDYLLDDDDRALLPWLKAFQKCDLYSKTTEKCSVSELKPYYMSLIHKYFPKYELEW